MRISDGSFLLPYNRCDTFFVSVRRNVLSQTDKSFSSISQVVSSVYVCRRDGAMTDHGQVFMNLSFYIESSSPKPSRTSFATAFLLYHASNTRYTYSRVISGGAMTNMKEKGSGPLSFHSSDLLAYSLPIPRSTHSSAKVTDR